MKKSYKNYILSWLVGASFLASTMVISEIKKEKENTSEKISKLLYRNSGYSTNLINLWEMAYEWHQSTIKDTKWNEHLMNEAYFRDDMPGWTWDTYFFTKSDNWYSIENIHSKETLLIKISSNWYLRFSRKTQDWKYAYIDECDYEQEIEKLNWLIWRMILQIPKK